MYAIISNYGNESIALIQWAYQQGLQDVYVLSVDTGWAAPGWEQRVQQAEAWVQSLGFNGVRLKPKANFATLMRTRGNFPSRKFQWCAGFLKGLPITDWLDTHDSRAEATILLARRQQQSRLQVNLPEMIEASEHYGDRRVWHPLYLHQLEQRNDLIQRAGFAILPHRSLECDPCVNSDLADALRLDPASLERTATLETELQGQLLDPAIYGGTKDLYSAIKRLPTEQRTTPETYELFEMGCGSHYACGL